MEKTDSSAAGSPKRPEPTPASNSRSRETESMLATQSRAQKKSVLVDLATSNALSSSDFKSFARLATEAAADTLGVERVGIWLFNENRTMLRCENLYERSTGRHSEGLELESERYPRYFAALERGRGVVADDAHANEATREFSEIYLTPLGISSMLDAPIRRAGRLVGVVCHEHVGLARSWAADEQDFAASIGDFVSLVLEGSERRKAEQAFRSAQEGLLRQQFQARRQIEFELDRIKDELVRQTRLATIGQVAASIAHELRNPLGAIRNAAFLLRQAAPAADPKWSGYLDIIEQEVRRSDITITDLLEMSQAKPPLKQPVDLATAARDSFDYVRSGEDVELVLRLDPDPFTVDADPGQLRQVLTNLFTNAVEAMRGAGRISVRGERDERFDCITVLDSGPGVPPEIRARLFEPLITTKVKGTGLGLAICSQIAERHGGAIRLVQAEGEGAAFRILLARSNREET